MHRARLTWMLALAALACAPAGARERAAGETLAITNVTVLAMNGTAAMPGRPVTVRDGRIVAVAPASDTALSAGARIVDARGKYVIPGLWDMHVHTAREGHAVVRGGRYIGPGERQRLLTTARAEAARAVPSPPALQ